MTVGSTSVTLVTVRYQPKADIRRLVDQSAYDRISDGGDTQQTRLLAAALLRSVVLI